MIRGFAVGSLALIILYAVVQPGASGRVDEASTTFVSGLRRLLSPGIAGVGNHNTAGTAPASSAGTAGRSVATAAGPYFQAL